MDTSGANLTNEIIKEINAQFKARFSHFADALFVIDWQTGDSIVACNDVACRLLGYTRDELLRMKYVNICPLEEEEPAVNNEETSEETSEETNNDDFAKMLRQVQTIQGHLNLRHKDGHTEHVTFNSWLVTLAKRELILNIATPLRNHEEPEKAGVELFQRFFKDVACGAVLIDFQTIGLPIIDCNAAYADMNGYQRHELVGRAAFDFSKEQDAQKYEQYLQEDQSHFIDILKRTKVTYEGRHKRFDGTYYYIHVDQSLIEVDGRELVLSLVQNINDFYMLQQDEKLRNRLLEMISHNTPLSRCLEEIAHSLEDRIQGTRCAIWQFKDDQLGLYAAPQLPESYSQTFDELVSLSGEKIFQLLIARRDMVIAPLPDVGLPGQKEDTGRMILRACWAFPIFQSQTLVGVIALFQEQPRGPSFSEMGIIETAMQLATTAFEHHLLNERLAYQALHDGLTGLPNRSSFQDRLGHAVALAERNNTKLGVLFLDLDGFKSINDELGHQAGDAILQEVARRVQTCVRRSDTVARLGGDEFVVLLTTVIVFKPPRSLRTKSSSRYRHPTRSR